jgi:hypothetical protein
MPDAANVQLSPECVPGAVTEPKRVRGQDLLFPGAAGTSIDGYLAMPAGPAQ